MKDIEDRLIARGISKEDIYRFANLAKHNGKKDIFRRIIYQSKWPENPKGLMENLMYILAKKGIEDFPYLNPENKKSQREYLGEDGYNLFVAQMIATGILEVLNNNSHAQFDNSLTLNKLYRETFKK